MALVVEYKMERDEEEVEALTFAKKKMKWKKRSFDILRILM